MAWISRAGALNQEEMENNANIVINYYRDLKFDDSTIAGLLGNMQNESSINPEREEVGGEGYGLVQWTPQRVLINHCNALGLSPYNDGDIQLQVIPSEVRNEHNVAEWYSTEAFIEPYYNSGATSDMIGITGEQFLSNEMKWTPDKLAILFMVCYERPSYDPDVNHYQKRMSDALTWLEYMGGVVPPTPSERGKGMLFLDPFGMFLFPVGKKKTPTPPVEYDPRLNDDGMMNNPYWYSLNPFYQAGVGLPNCTCYAWGRRYEITKEAPTLSLGNADEWYGYTTDGYKRGSEPKLGAVICYSGGSIGTGHVGVVEVIHGDGSIITSNSNYGAEYFITYNLVPPNYALPGLTFQGFIYLDKE